MKSKVQPVMEMLAAFELAASAKTYPMNGGVFAVSVDWVEIEEEEALVVVNTESSKMTCPVPEAVVEVAIMVYTPTPLEARQSQ